jgi:hypothetical protein
VGFWDGVKTVWLDNGDIGFLLPDGRLLSVDEMHRRELAYQAGRDPDEPFTPDVDAVDVRLVRAGAQTTAPSSSSESDGGPCRML